MTKFFAHDCKPDLFSFVLFVWFVWKGTLSFNICLFVILSGVWTIKNRYASSQQTRQIAVKPASHPLRQPLQPIKGPDWHKQLITQLCAACKDRYLYIRYLWSVCSILVFPVGSWSDTDPKFSTFLLIILTPDVCSFLSVRLSMQSKAYRHNNAGRERWTREWFEYDSGALHFSVSMSAGLRTFLLSESTAGNQYYTEWFFLVFVWL